MEGIICVDKPCGISSFKVVQMVRRVTKVKKVGHAGTLDPFASGLLIIAIGKQFTRQLHQYQALEKEYLLRIVLGIETDTYDSYGRIVQTSPPPKMPSQSTIITQLATFEGDYEQIPPRFSAKKIDGKRAYKRARNNESFEMKPSMCKIYNLSLDATHNSHYPLIDLQLTCSKGTYARTIGYDLGKKLNTFATTIHLIRSKIGPYSLQQALKLNELTPTHIQTNSESLHNL